MSGKHRSTIKNCAFCRIIRGEEPADRVFEDDQLLAFLDVCPLNIGHALIIPKVHHTSITTLPRELSGLLLSKASSIGTALMRVTGGGGFNLLLANGICAGQAVHHVHMHIIPRDPVDGLIMPARTVPWASDEAKQEFLRKVRERLAG